MTNSSADRDRVIKRFPMLLEPLVVSLSAPVLIFPGVRPKLTVMALVLLVGTWMLRTLVRKEPWPQTPFNGALLLFSLMIPVSIWVSAHPDLTLPKATGLILGLAAFRVVVWLVDAQKRFVLSLWLFCFLGVGILAVGVVSTRWLDKVPFLSELTARVPRLIGSLPDLPSSGIHPNQLAGALNLFMPLSFSLLALMLLVRKTTARLWVLLWAAAGFAGMISLVLLLTQSRSGWLGGAAGTFTLALLWSLTSARRWMRKLGVGFLLSTVMVILIFTLVVGPQRVAVVLYSAESEAAVETIVGEMTLAGRLEIWNRARYAIQDFALTGCGLGTFREVVHTLYPLFLLSPQRDIAHAHNIFLQTGLDLGVPGLIAYLAILVVAVMTGWKHIRQDDPLRRSVALGLTGGLVGLHVYGLTDALALGSKPGLAFWWALGLMAGMEHVPGQITDALRLEVNDLPGTLRWLQKHKRHLLLVLTLVLLLMAALGYWGWQLMKEDEPASAPSSFRVPIYGEANDLQIWSETPTGSDWMGPLEIATFTTTHALTDVVHFYTETLPVQSWRREIEVGDLESWGALYIKDEGYAVCLFDTFTRKEEAWVSIVCGDKQTPLDLSGLPPLPMPTAASP